ncbi:hypothetical protein [Streptomyces stelliscabiei]|uniref:hypothetical protein n=1 Tax=Streptomyces stelliscabiei TaxID=146820 RepID=UPI0029AB2A38|nr:hypothetical protein [Streptomyces stelliscabiei]MDX2667428.1 hypothetical protein [Streptomyces stelliscabiei]MDX2785967.1 hypothetical protein [Streptomyces stelliscabiei]
MQETYLGWSVLPHAEDCHQPAWEVGQWVDDDAYRYKRASDPPRHGCTDEDCDHGNRFTETVLRVVCRSCGWAHVISGEFHSQRHTTTERLGYGQAPRRTAGLLLWPGDPWLNVFREETDQPHDFLVTRLGVERVTRDAVAGQITQGRGKRGAVLWAANAAPSETGEYGGGLGSIRWAYAEDGFKTPVAAAKWIAARLADAETAGGAA